MIRQSLITILKNGTQLLEHFTQIPQFALTENISVLNAARNKSGILTKKSGFVKRWNVRNLQQHTSKSQVASPFSRYFSRFTSNNEKIMSILRKHCPEYINLQRSAQGQAARYFGRPISLVAFGFTAIGFKTDGKEVINPDRICHHIKNYFHNSKDCELDSQFEGGGNIDSYQFGGIIAKGCNAAVYEACYNTDTGSEKTLDEEHTEMEISFGENDEDNQPSNNVSIMDDTISTSFEVIEEDFSPTEDSTSVSHCSEDSIEVLDNSECDALLLHNPDNGDVLVIEAESDDESVELNLREDENISLSSASGVTGYSNSLGNLNLQEHEPEQCSEQMNGLAIKMMYNYHTSNEMSILNNMKMETLPLRNDIVGIGDEMWEKRNHVKKKALPPHPNIVEMYHVFFGEVPELDSCMEEYPTALPFRINPDGCGRNKTMFSVMKKYPYTLKTYLSGTTPSLEESISMLSQLVDAVAHMVDNGIAHRDLKSDNILVEETPSGPHLVVCDFGCAMADGLVLHLSSEYVCRGGNAQLMAPEILKAKPGPSCYLDYSKADLWAVGALAYDIFGSSNPFSRGHGSKLRNTEYVESDLPDLPANIPSCLNSLVKSMLKCNPTERPTAMDVSGALHYLRWSHAVRGLSNTTHSDSEADDHLFAGNLLPKSETQLTRWLLLLSAHAILGQRLYKQQKFEIEAKKRFLSTVSIIELKRAISLLEPCVN